MSLGLDVTSDETLTVLTIKTPRSSDATQIRGMMEAMIDMGMSLAKIGAQEAARQGGVYVPPLLFEFSRGFLRTLLPKVDGDKLKFEVKAGGAPTVLGTVGMGIGLLLPAVQSAREAARRMQCTNNMSQIAFGLHTYVDSMRGLPPLYTVDANGKPLHSWRVLLLPYLEENTLYQSIRLDEPWDSEWNRQFHNVTPVFYRCPSNEEACCYSAVVGGALKPAEKAGQKMVGGFETITDGWSNTIFAVEVREPFCWMDPTADVTLEDLEQGINRGGHVGSNHPDVANIGLLDGSVRSMPDSLPGEVLRALGDPTDGKFVDWNRF